MMDFSWSHLPNTHLGILHCALASLLSPGTEANGTTMQISPENGMKYVTLNKPGKKQSIIMANKHSRIMKWHLNG